MQQQKKREKNRIKLYWLLLLSVLLVGSVTVSVGITQARYGNTVTSPVVLKASAMDISSNCLVSAGDAARTVLLGEIDLDKSMTVPFWVLSAGADREVKLNWGISDQEHIHYFNIDLLVGEETLTAGETIVLPEDVRLELMLRLVPTVLARTTVHGEAKINVHVTLDDTMWGTFQVILPAVQGSTEAVAVSEEPEAEAAEAAAVVEEEPEAMAEPTPEPTVEPTEEPEATAEPTVEPTVEPRATSEPTIEPTVEPSATPEATLEPTPTPTVEPSATPTPTIEPTPEPTATPQPTIEPTPEPTLAPTANPYEEQEALVELNAMSTFDLKRQLPVVMTLAEHITSVRLGIQAVCDKETVPEEAVVAEAVTEVVTLEALPDYTMFSVDGGNSYYMVYGDYIPELILHEITTVPLLMDFRYTKLKQDEELTIAMEAYMGRELRKTCTAVTKASEVIEAENLMGSILNFENTLDFIFPMNWRDMEMKYTVEYLTVTGDQTLKYVPANLSEDSLQTTYINDENNHRLELKLGKKFKQPGTYRITISCSYEGLCYDTMQTTFFVNCSGREEKVTNGSEVQNDE